MWRKQEEFKPSPPASDLVVSPATHAVRTSVVTAGEPRSSAGNVSKAISIKGQISGSEDLYIDGEVQGTIRLTDGNVIIGPNGQVSADIDAREIVVHGHVKGALHGRERVQIGHSGEVLGDVLTRRIAIEEGAVLRGKVEVTGTETARASRSPETPAGTESLRPVPVRAGDSR